jgi:hypothetical protein
MAYPTTPLRLQVIDRAVTVLQAISAGTSYFYTPYAVQKRLMHWKECGGFPTYMIFMSRSEEPERHLDNEYMTAYTISVQGWVDLEMGEPQSKLCKCIRDVEKAINEDSKSTTAGSLGALASNGLVDIGAVETDNGGFSLEGFAFFEQLVSIKLIGDWGDF